MHPFLGIYDGLEHSMSVDWDQMGVFNVVLWQNIAIYIIKMETTWNRLQSIKEIFLLFEYPFNVHAWFSITMHITCYVAFSLRIFNLNPSDISR